MLYFSRWKVVGILLTALIVCAFAIPNFFSERRVQSWPKWAQRHIVLGLDLQGGSHLLLEVDSNAVRREKLEALRDSLVEIHSHADQITLHYPIRYYNMLLSLADMVQSADGAPTKQEGDVYRDIAAQVDRHIAQLRALETTEVVAFNRMMRELDVPAVVTGR